jgi:uncharacterized membrane protein/thiol-disulfide isomerase/thioredoxin
MVSLLLATLLLQAAPLGAQTPVVYIVYFYTPTCPNCKIVSEETLPPLRERYGDQLRFLEIDISRPDGNAIFQAAVDRFNIPGERKGVPLMIVGETVMVGSNEIPAQLPDLIESQLAAGGVDLPDLPNIEAWASRPQPEPTLDERWARDPAGNTLAVVLLVAMSLMLLFVSRPARWQERLARRVPFWATFAVEAVGLGAALYLTITELQEKEAFCGPVGRCNVVQQSQYAYAFGVVPLALIGVLGYIALMATHAYGKWGKGKLADYAPLAFFGMAWFGFLTSIGLTYLQPFVIGATCFWCLTSATSMSLSLLLNAGPGWDAVKGWQKQHGRGKRRRYSRRRRR